MHFEKILYSKKNQFIDFKSLREKKILSIKKDIFYELAKIAFTQMRFFLGTEHLNKWFEILISLDASQEEKEKIKINFLATIESKNKNLPYCQDCGTDILYLFRGDKIIFSGEKNIFDHVQEGATFARKKNPFRSSIFLPTENFSEKNSGDNSPCELHNFFWHKEDEVYGIFCNKGGGSGSKFWNFSKKPSLAQNRHELKKFLYEKISEIGHSACPPYNFYIVLGGLSQLQNSEILTRASVEDPFLEKNFPFISQDQDLEKEIMQDLKKANIGAQTKGKYFMMTTGIKIFRAPRHAVPFFVGMGLSCSANRIQHFKINKDGIFLEKLEKNPEKFLLEKFKNQTEKSYIKNNLADKKGNLFFQKDFKQEGPKKFAINLDKEKNIVLKKLRNLKSGENFLFSGNVIIARDKAHFCWWKNFQEKKFLPNYLKKYLAVLYIGPADIPKNEIIGSIGPTTAARMDEFAEFLFKNNLLFLSIAKGSRSKKFALLCKKYKGIFAAVQGGPASYLRKFVCSQKILDFEDLGMEAVRLFEIKNMPAQIIVDSNGNDFYQEMMDKFIPFDTQFEGN